MSESLVASHPTVGPLLTERAQRAKLLEAMVRVVADKGYAAATVADAVRLAKVSRGTFYELFDSKQACLMEGYRLGIEVLAQRIDDLLRPHRVGVKRSGRSARTVHVAFDAFPRPEDR